MDCGTFHKNLEDYLEGGLDFAGRFGMERHAQQCLGCGKVVGDAQKLSQMARESKQIGAPPDFETQLLRRIQMEGLTRPSWKCWRLPLYLPEWPSWRSIAASAFALALVAFSVFFMTRWTAIDHSSTSASAARESAAHPLPQRDGAASGAHAASNSASMTETSRLPGTLSPVKAPANRARTIYSTERDSRAVQTDSSVSDYVEYLVPGPGNRQYIMRLPKTIWMRYGQPSEEYFIRNVSH